MERHPTHILLCGNRRSGRSSMIRALLNGLPLPVAGFMTRTMNTRPDGYHQIYMFPYGEENPQPVETCHIGDCNTRERVIHNEVFNTLGVELLQQKAGHIFVLDEIGFMESDAKTFCSTVLERLAGDVPVLAAVRTSIMTPFLHEVLAAEKAFVVRMEPKRFQAQLDELRPLVRDWAEKCALC